MVRSNFTRLHYGYELISRPVHFILAPFMKKILIALCAPILLVSCGGNSDTTEEKNDEIANDSTQIESVIYTAHGAIEGMGSEVYIFPPGAWDGNTAEVTPFTELHVIPYSTPKNGIYKEMMELCRTDFRLSDPFDSHTGKVKVYFDKEKRHVAAEYSVINGNAEGNVKLFTPKGVVFMEREYHKGKCFKNIKSPASADWNFNASTSNITLRDPKNGDKYINGKRVINLIPTIDPKSGSLHAILDKSTYVRPLKVNDRPYTGRLNGYLNATDVANGNFFNLDFVNGLLDGDVKIYDEWGTFTLHEIFSKGVLVSTPYVVDLHEMEGMAKPIIYLYPEDTTDIIVSLNLNGKLTHTYPRYENGWKVTAHPDGTLFDQNGKEYYALYWEGQNAVPFTLNEGAIVKGENTIAFLEASLETLGLNRREANEFIMYWLPRMENNAYNLIHFSTDEYESIAGLNVTPKPETMIRVMMVFQPLKNSMDLPKQNLEAIGKTRKGFTVVEWGGEEVRSKVF